jgi:uncharacterized protein YjiS (DUF1127 family)
MTGRGAEIPSPRWPKKRQRNINMATTTTFDTTHARGGHGFFAGVRKAFADYRLYRQTLAELDALSNRELRDLGLSRLSIRQVAYDSVYGA